MGNPTILFEAIDSSGNAALFVTDSAAAGISELVSGLAANGGLQPTDLVSDGSLVLFDGVDAAGDFNLYVSDGTSAGTTELVVTDANSIGLFPEDLTPFNGEVYFAGLDNNGTLGLWVTNGTAGGTTELAVANVASNGLQPSQLAVVDGGSMLAFAGEGPGYTDGLWLSNGTATGTTEIYVGSAGGGVSPQEITALNATTFVFAGQDAAGNEELFVSNGTGAGTSELTGIAGAPSDAQGDFVYQGGNMAVLNGRALFAAYDNSAANTVDLWSTDGTAGGTTELTVANADTTPFEGLTPTDLTQLGTLVLFNGLDASGNAGLWTTNGTGTGTTELTGIAGAASNFDPTAFSVIGDVAYFYGEDTSGHDALWVTDGTVGGTSEVSEVNAGDLTPGVPEIAGVVPCFAGGTRILTLCGERAVEALRVGDMAVTHDGSAAAIRWIGRRLVACAAHPRPRLVWPVRIAAGAFGAGLPRRELRLSPDHAVFFDGVLIPVRYLINGTTVAQVPVARVTYWHVELPRHAVLLAEGMTVESYLETGQRGCFDNGGGALRLHPDFTAAMRDAAACAPFVVTGPALERVRARLSRTAARAAA